MLDDVMSGWKWHVEAFAFRLGFLERHAAPRECPDWSAFHGVHALDSHADLGDSKTAFSIYLLLPSSSHCNSTLRMSSSSTLFLILCWHRDCPVSISHRRDGRKVKQSPDVSTKVLPGIFFSNSSMLFLRFIEIYVQWLVDKPVQDPDRNDVLDLERKAKYPDLPTGPWSAALLHVFHMVRRPEASAIPNALKSTLWNTGPNEAVRRRFLLARLQAIPGVDLLL